MTIIHVCRHGQDEDNSEGILNGRRDRPLTLLGRQQANTLASQLLIKIKKENNNNNNNNENEKKVKYDIIISSPLKRAYETAQIIASTLNIPIEVEEELIERDFGILSGKPISQIKEYAGDNNIIQGDKVMYFLNVDGAETFEDCYQRAARVLKRIDDKYNNKNILLVCHGDIGKMLQAVRKNITWKEGLQLPYFANTEVLEL